jgi:hypothetical protein
MPIPDLVYENVEGWTAKSDMLHLDTLKFALPGQLPPGELEFVETKGFVRVNLIKGSSRTLIYEQAVGPDLIIFKRYKLRF